MDDFLHNLRSGKLKQPDRGRRDYADYKGPQRRAGNDRRRPDYYAKVTSENFALVKDTLDILAEHQKRIADNLSTRKRTEVRIADALEALVAMLGRKWGYEDLVIQGDDPSDADTHAEMSDSDMSTDRARRPASGANASRLGAEDKSELIKTITAMREAGDSWEKIARHFDDQRIPTVSGKGKWRGPGIKKFWESHT